MAENPNAMASETFASLEERERNLSGLCRLLSEITGVDVSTDGFIIGGNVIEFRYVDPLDSQASITVTFYRSPDDFKKAPMLRLKGGNRPTFELLVRKIMAQGVVKFYTQIEGRIDFQGQD